MIRKISEYSFGIYLYSDPLNYLLLFIVNTLYSQYIYTAMGITILYFARLFVTFFGGMLMTYILKKLKIKYIK